MMGIHIRSRVDGGSTGIAAPVSMHVSCCLCAQRAVVFANQIQDGRVHPAQMGRNSHTDTGNVRDNTGESAWGIRHPARAG